MHSHQHEHIEHDHADDGSQQAATEEAHEHRH